MGRVWQWQQPGSIVVFVTVCSCLGSGGNPEVVYPFTANLISLLLLCYLCHHICLLLAFSFLSAECH
jgi:hypothetical protein